MENFPTLHRPLLPWVVNGLTLVVVLAATWWSSDHRPLTSSTDALNSAASPAPLAAPGRQPATVPAAGPTLVVWPAQTTALPSDSIKPVGFTVTVMR